MKLPVVKILWGMFAFPALYPASFFRATAWPLLGLIGITLVWASGGISADDRFTYLGVFVANYAVFAWLAVRTHRLVLAGTEGVAQERSDVVPVSFRYLAALVAGTALKYVCMLAIVAIVMLLTFLISLPAQMGQAVASAVPPTPPPPDPTVQHLLDYGAMLLPVPALYLLARWSPMLPAIALGHDWAPRTAWRQTRGNGWRLVLVVFLIPWALSAAVDWAYRNTEGAMIIGIISIVRAVFLALGVIALSLSYRELTATPAPPPTTQPA